MESESYSLFKQLFKRKEVGECNNLYYFENNLVHYL